MNNWNQDPNWKIVSQINLKRQNKTQHLKPSILLTFDKKIIDKFKYGQSLEYLDILPALNKSFESFLMSLNLVLRKSSEIELKARIKKCSFKNKEIQFLAFVVSDKGIRTDTNALLDLFYLKTLKQVQC